MKNKKILLIDDEIQLLNALRRELINFSAENQLEILIFNSPLKALKTIKKDNKEIAIIISDQKMPDLKGSDLLLKVKEINPDIVSIILTAYTDISEIIKSIKAGIFSYILKPWDIDILLAEIKKGLNIYNLKEENRLHFNNLKEELKWGGELQKLLLKREIPESDKINISVTYDPLPELNCGGDYYDIFNFSNDIYLILIGDVSGHGIKAAFITVMLKTIIYRGYISSHLKSDFSPADFLAWLNNSVYEELKNLPDVIISFSACLINLKKKLLTFSNAGHFPLLVLRNNQIIEIKLEGAAFGLKKNNKYNENHFQINNQDKIILYSDGLKELKMNDNITFEKILLKNINASDYSIKVIEEIKLQSQEKKYLDDVTFISIDIK